uniref:Serine/threonine-protein phosphatase PGAM5, mitochondrial n=1 Tax=Echinostoma caproni TaxID=27848 RepID=A0A183B3S8_9TREM
LIRARQTTAALLIGLSDDTEDTLMDVPTLTNLSAPYRCALQGNYSATIDQSHRSSTELAEYKIGKPYIPYPGAPFYCQESQYLAEGPPPVAPQPPGASSTSDKFRAIEGRRLEDGFRVHINRLGLTDTVSSDSAHDETVVFVGHANVFRYWLCRALQLPPEAWLRIQLYHGSVSCLVLHFEPGPDGACVVTATRI